MTKATHALELTDPFQDDQFERVNAVLATTTELATEHFGGSGLHRRRTSDIDRTAPGTALLLEEVESFGHWLSTIPTAAALHPLYDPETATFTDGTPLCEEIRSWFRNIADARGIRSRATVMRTLLMQHAALQSKRQQWLSLASGAAQPVFATVEDIGSQGGLRPEVVLADLDRSALHLARAYAADHQLDSVTAVRLNVLRRRGFSRPPRNWPLAARQPTWRGAFDVVDAVGILEYLKPEDWTYTYSGVVTTKKRLAGAVTFLRNAFECVRPGGLLLVGNMLDTHPQLDFTLNVIQWPHIQPRSVDQMMEIFDRAELAGHVDAYLPSDGVYAIYAVRRPPHDAAVEDIGIRTATGAASGFTEEIGVS